MPVKIGTFGPLSEAEFTELQRQKARKAAPAMTALLAEIAIGHPVRVPLVEGQSARGLRTAISRAASSRGMSVETLEGNGFVAVRKIDEPRPRKQTQQSAEPGKRRGRPRKRQDHSLGEILAAADNERIVPKSVIETGDRDLGTRLTASSITTIVAVSKANKSRVRSPVISTLLHISSEQHLQHAH